jgi:co-chaperonin GroES (HSP10)
MKYRAVGANIIVQKIQKESEKKQLIIVANPVVDQFPLYKILEIGDLVPIEAAIEKGESVMLVNYAGYCIDEKQEIYCTSYDKILLVVEEE